MEEIEALFGQISSGFESAEGRITLKGVSPSTLYFADRPKREAGHISSQYFVDIWTTSAARSLAEQKAGRPPCNRR